MKYLIKIEKVSKNNAPHALLLLADPSLELIKKHLEFSECYVGTFEEKVIGVFLLKKIDSIETELLNIAVDPSYQSKGIGTFFLKNAIETSRLSGAKKLVLGTGTFGYQLSFYQRQGFRVESICKNFFLDHYSDPIFEDEIQHKDMLRLYLDL